MKKFAVICLFLASLHARADLVIVESVQAAGQNQDITVKIKGEKIRTDVGTEMSTIMDLGSGDLLMLMHSQKMFMKVGGKLKSLLDQVKKMQAEASAAGTTPKYTDTGKQEKVGDHNAEIYTTEAGGKKLTIWMAKDFPNYAAIQEQMKQLESIQALSGNSAMDTSKLDGVPVKVEITMDGGTKIITNLVSIKQDPIDDAEFQAPADYKEMQAPQTPALAPSGSDAPAPSGGGQ